MKMKNCSNCSYVGPIYKNVSVDGVRLKLCKSCAMKHNAKNTIIKPTLRTPIKPISDKRKKRNTAYKLARDLFMLEEVNKLCPVNGSATTEIHHMNGRENERLLDREFWLAVSREGHQWIHNNPIEARAKGWLI